jgi:predicted RecA/RadA family phage recombinase
MKTFVQTGNTIEVTAPYALLSGQGALVGNIFGIASTDAANGATVNLAVNGVFDITTLTTDVAAQGALVYWDNTNKRMTITSAGNTKVGVFTVAKISGPGVGRIRLSSAF